MPVSGTLDADDLPDDGLIALRGWMDAAVSDERVRDARAGCLATADAYGAPDARMVVVRELGDDGLIFCTSLVSVKAQQLDVRGVAAVVLWWQPLMRQVRVRGSVARLAEREADEQFSRLHRRSRIAAWASDQTAELDHRAELETAFRTAAERFPGDVPRPQGWGGYRLRAETVELWQGHPGDGIHDRFRYERRGDHWRLRRLAP